jgi:hypothetical protein
LKRQHPEEINVVSEIALNVQLDRKEGSLEVELPTWQETFHNPTTTRPTQSSA